MTRRMIWLPLVLLLMLAACAPMVKDGQPATAKTEVVLQAGQTVGQTFTARDRGLNGVEIFLAPDTPGASEIRLHLRADSQSSVDLAVGTLAAQAVSAPGFYRFAFEPQRDSSGCDYYLLLELQGDAKLRVGSAAGDVYLDGALYQNGTPLDAQMAFRLAYDPVEVAIGLAAMAMTWLQVLVVAILLFVLPGWALLMWLLPGWSARPWCERLGLAGGVSVAVYPLLLLWTDLVGLHLGALYAWLPVLAAIVALAWRNRAWRLGDPVAAVRAWRQSPVVWSDLAFVVLIALIFGVRFWAIRSLDVPMWGDSYQHTMIAQLLVDNGGLFDSWEPYAELQTFTYHFGFHAAAAAFHWVGGLDMPRAVLWTGQIVNGLAIIALYPLAVRVSGNRWAGVGAVLVAGLLSPMPMVYVNWGRYTQLAGQVILPTAICLSWAALEAKSRDWRLVALAWIALSGLALAHYRILIFAVLFLVAFFVLQVREKRTHALLSRICLLGVGAGLLFLPWLIHTYAGRLTLILTQQLTTPAAAVSIWMQQYNAIGDLFSYLPVWLWLPLPLSIGWGLWRRQKGVALVGLWWFLILLVANPEWLRLPGEGTLSNFAVFIAAYIPAGVLLGDTLGSWRMMGDALGLSTPAMLGIRSAQGWRNAFALVLLLLATGSALWGARERLGDVRVAQHNLVTRPDLRAAAWIPENTPYNARFLVNSFFAYGDTLIVGSDAGWWLPLLASRQTTLPPINYESEQGTRSDYVEWINALSAEIRNKGINHPDVLAKLGERDITHIYIGQRQGRVNYDGPYVLQPQQLLADSHFHPAYHQDRVWVFEVNR